MSDSRSFTSRLRKVSLRRSLIAGAVVSILVAVGMLGPSAASGSKKASVLTIAEDQLQPSYDPATAVTYQSDELQAVYDTLVTLLPKGKIGPDLATSWKAEGLSITFKLRQGVKFQDGTPFDADAVKKAFDRLQDPATKALNAKGVLGPYQSSTVIDPYTIKITWSAPYAGALIDLANSNLSIPSPTAAAAGTLATHPVGTGPYTFGSLTPQSQLVVNRNPDYTSIRPDLANKGAPKYDQIVFSYVLSEPTRANLLKTNGAQVGRLDGVYAKQAAANSSLDTRQFPSILEYWLEINSRKITDINLRNAIFAAIDRKAIIATAGGGFGHINTNAIPTGISGYSATIKVPQYNVKQAKQYFAKANPSLSSKTFQILAQSTAPFPGIATLVQDELKQVGIKTKIVELPVAAENVARAKGQQAIYIGYYGILDPMGALGLLWGCSSIPNGKNVGYNFAFWCNKNFDKLITAAKADTNETTRNAKLVAAQRILMAARVSMTLYESASVVVSSKSLGGVSLQPDGILRINDLRPSG